MLTRLTVTLSAIIRHLTRSQEVWHVGIQAFLTTTTVGEILATLLSGVKWNAWMAVYKACMIGVDNVECVESTFWETQALTSYSVSKPFGLTSTAPVRESTWSY